jgi:hypothetical protein
MTNGQTFYNADRECTRHVMTQPGNRGGRRPGCLAVEACYQPPQKNPAGTTGGASTSKGRDRGAAPSMKTIPQRPLELQPSLRIGSLNQSGAEFLQPNIEFSMIALNGSQHTVCRDDNSNNGLIQYEPPTDSLDQSNAAATGARCNSGQRELVIIAFNLYARRSPNPTPAACAVMARH